VYQVNVVSCLLRSAVCGNEMVIFGRGPRPEGSFRVSEKKRAYGTTLSVCLCLPDPSHEPVSTTPRSQITPHTVQLIVHVDRRACTVSLIVSDGVVEDSSVPLCRVTKRVSPASVVTPVRPEVTGSERVLEVNRDKRALVVSRGAILSRTDKGDGGRFGFIATVVESAGSTLRRRRRGGWRRKIVNVMTAEFLRCREMRRTAGRRGRASGGLGGGERGRGGGRGSRSR